MGDPLDALYTTPAMAAAFSPETHLRGMLRFEAALARAEARAGIIPWEAAEAIATTCDTGDFDTLTIYREAAVAGTPAIPLVRMLTAQVEPQGRGYVHWGATSQDAIDTATVLQMREGLGLLEADLSGLASVCATLAERHRHTLMAGRTLLQQALPIPFGLKAARWLGVATRQIVELRRQRNALVLQFGGAAGTLAALGGRGLEVAELLGLELQLPVPDLPWHAERDRPAAVATALGVTAGAMAKIAQDILLLGQTEIGEVSEGEAPGKGGSSAMPHKRNPVDSIMATAAARLAIGEIPVILAAMSQEHERAAGGWQAEWEAIPRLFRFTAGAVARVLHAVAGLQINEDVMRVNLERDGGILMAESLAMALAPSIGRSEAQRLVQEACARAIHTGHSLQQTAMDDDRMRSLLSFEDIARTLDPSCYLGSADVLIDRTLEAYRDMLRPESNHTQ